MKVSVEIQVEKLSPKPGDILVFRGVAERDLEEIARSIPGGVTALSLPEGIKLSVHDVAEVRQMLDELEKQNA